MVSEAIVAGTPVIASRIAGNVGLLGEDYQGYFEPGDAQELAGVILRAETDRFFLAELNSHCANLMALFDAAVERSAWIDLLGEIAVIFNPDRSRK